MRRALATSIVAAAALALPAAAATPAPVTTVAGDRISISGDGSLVAYQGFDGLSAFVVDTRTFIKTRLTYYVDAGERRNANGRRPSISADGTKVLVSARRLGTDPGQNPDQLWLVDLAGNATRVSNGLPEAPREVSLAGNASAAVFTVTSGPLYYLKLGGSPVQVALRGLNPSISSDGRKVAYLWDSTAYVWDATTGKTTAVNRTEKGVALVAAIEPRISGNGRYVSFAARLPTQRYGQQAYRKDIVTGKLVQLSVDTKGREGTKAVVKTAISSSGDRVAFVTEARLTSDDTDSGSDIYVKDLSDGTLFRVAPAYPIHLVLSGDGSTVAWSAGGGTVSLYTQRIGSGETCIVSARALAALQGDCARIKAVTVDFDERQQLRLAALKPIFLRLAARKEKLEVAVPAASRELAEVNASDKALQPKINAIEDLIGRTLRGFEDLRKAERELTKEERGLLRSLETLENSIGGVENQILDAKEAGRDASALQSRLKKMRSQQRELDKIVSERVVTDLADVRAAWAASLRSLQAKVFELREAESALLGRKIRAKAQLLKLVAEQRDVDAELVAVGARLEGFDPLVEEVTVEANGKLVFRAVPGADLAKLVNLDQEIDELARVVTRLEAQRLSIRVDYVDAEKKTIAAERRLGTVLYRLAFARFFTDLGFQAWDVIKATSKGGVVGALTELTKKGIEARMFDVEKGSGIAPGSIEAEINARFKAGLKDSLSGERLGRTIGERIMKEAVKVTKDDLVNQTLGKWLYRKFELPFRARLDVPISLSPIVSSTRAERASEHLSHLHKQWGALRKGYATDPKAATKLSSFKSLGESLTRDALKAGLNGAYDLAERNAWIEFFTRDAESRTLYGIWYAAADQWERAYESYEQQLERKAKLLQGLEGAFKTAASSDFDSGATLRVTLKVKVHADGPDNLQVVVGGVTATRIGKSHVYTVKGFDANSAGVVKLVLR